VNSSAITAGLRGDNGAAQGNVHVRPAVEVQAAGDLSIASNWDLTGPGWLTKAPGSTTTEAGSLIVRAGGNLKLASASIGNPDDSLRVGETWNIALASGADLVAANPLRTQSAQRLAAQAASGLAGPGDLLLDSQSASASIRTGTGNIQLAAGRDFVINAGDVDPNTGNPLIGVVYTAGKAAIADPLLAPSEGRFATGGGNVSIAAGRNATGAGDEWMTEWFRALNLTDNDPQNGVWWPSRPNFLDGIGALGGGNVAIVAGNNISDLSAWVPTSARLVGSGTAASLQVFGGGNLNVRAGNDIVGGQYMASRGVGTIVAGGSIGAAHSPTEVYVMGASGDPALAQSTVNVSAGGSVSLAGINNPGTIYQTQTGFGGGPGYDGGSALQMLSYSANSAAHVLAEGGDLTIGVNPVYASPLASNAVEGPDIALWLGQTQLAVFPAQVGLTAFSGSIISAPGAQAILFPSSQGSLKLLAGKSIVDMNAIVSDADPTRFASYLSIGAVDPNVLVTKTSTPNRLVTNTVTDTYVNDVVALGGSIIDPSFTFPTRSRLWAAGDIQAPQLSLQNLNASDLSAVIADKGSIFDRMTLFGISGPGNLLVQAGQDVSLGTRSMVSSGNQTNASLLDPTGAGITLLAGVSGVVDLAEIGPIFDALILAGKNHDTAAAKTAVDALFAKAKVGSGNINSYLTSVQSNAGAPIDLLAPGGNITVGLTTSDPNKVGLVTNAGGAIRSYLSGDFDINRGKVVTVQGGDIVIYTASGSIDAGRGAKTAVTTPPPTRVATYDDKGNLTGYTYTLPAAITGSGIQTATSKPGGPTSAAPPAGNIYLFAPSGTIDAGEAGIASGGSIYIAALTVLNADNISSAGTSVGVPQVAVGSVASSLAASGTTNVTGASREADSAAQAAAAAAQADAAGAFKPAILTVEVLGFGDKNCKEQDKDCLQK
jgi:hypothetical protein